MTTELVRGAFVAKVDGREVRHEYAYMARASTLWDAELIAWAERRASEVAVLDRARKVL